MRGLLIIYMNSFNAASSYFLLHAASAVFYCFPIFSHCLGSSTALCFTCAWYSSIVTGGLLHLLVVQVINVSYNVTEREARVALRDKTARSAYWGLVVDTGIYSQGFRGNWAEFMTMGEKLNPPSSTSADLVWGTVTQFWVKATYGCCSVKVHWMAAMSLHSDLSSAAANLISVRTDVTGLLQLLSCHLSCWLWHIAMKTTSPIR